MTLLSEEITATILHAIPGRIRVRVEGSARAPETMSALASAVSQIAGVQEVRINPTTGSLLALYDPNAVSIEEMYIAARAARLNITAPGSPSSPGETAEVSQVARNITSSFGRVDSAISSVTGGRLDAKTLVPLGLGAAAVRQIATTGAGLSAIPWYILLWYSYGIFTKYNLRRNPELGGQSNNP